MRVGVPKEIKDQEFRVGLTPSSIRALTEAGHQVLVETGAGAGAGFSDEAYERSGALIGPQAEAWACDLVVKVKEPLESEYDLLRKDQILFTYLHLAAHRSLTECLLTKGTIAIAYESVETLGSRGLPLLHPMSVIAGRLAVQFGAHFLQRPEGGRGVLLGGVPGVPPGLVVILGGGVVGTEAARIAVGMGARVQIIELSLDRLGLLETLFGSRVELSYSSAAQLEAAVPAADLLVGAVLLPGRRAPLLVPRSLVEKMRPGSVIIDVAVDQGGCVETVRPTSHSCPTYTEAGVLHYGVPNMPGAVPCTATQALNNATLPYILRLAGEGLGAMETDPGLGRGLNVRRGSLVHPVLREIFPDLA